jgi:hypothetical protein
MVGQVASLNKAWFNKLAPRGSAKVLRIQARAALEPPRYGRTKYMVRRMCPTLLCRHDDKQRPPAFLKLRPGFRREIKHAMLSGLNNSFYPPTWTKRRGWKGPARWCLSRETMHMGIWVPLDTL